MRHCYYHRLYYDQLGGMELDVFGAKRRRWNWKDQETHVHAPPFQPICLRLNHNTSLRVMSQEAIALTFMANRRSCRFGVGARLKVRVDNHFSFSFFFSFCLSDWCRIYVQGCFFCVFLFVVVFFFFCFLFECLRVRGMGFYFELDILLVTPK